MRDSPTTASAGGGGKVIAYLTSAYARASDSFIRGEVLQLRKLGFTVHTFSIRRPDAGELVSHEIRSEHANTEFILEKKNLPKLLGASLGMLLRRPGKMLRAARLALRGSPPGIKNRLWSLAYLAEAAFLAGRLEANDVRHLHNHIGENSAAVAMLASALSGIPYSLTIHGPGEFDRPTLLALDDKIARAAFVVAVTQYGRSQLYRWSDPAHWPRIHVVHCGVNGTFLHQDPAALPPVPAALPPVPAAPRLVCIGRLAEQKGIPILVEAAAKLAAEGLKFELVLVGDGPLRGPIEKMIADRGLKDAIKLAGWMGSDGVREQILASRAMVLPSFAEGLPVVIMEALALGRPVISTYVAGIPELVRPGVCGWLVPPGATDDLVNAMREALTAPPERLAEMGRAGAALVARRHDAGVEAGKLARLIGGVEVRA